MIITIWRKRTHNLICGPSSFLEATPPRREHLQLLLKTKNSAWADFSVTKCEKSWKEAVGALLNNDVRLSFPHDHNQGGNTTSTCCASYWGTLGRVEEQERDWKKKIKKGVEQNNSWSCMSEMRRPEIWKHLRDCTFVSCSYWCWRRLISGGAGRRRKPGQREDNFPLSGLQVHLLLDDKTRVQEIHQRRSLHRAHTDSSPTKLALQISVCRFYRDEES